MKSIDSLRCFIAIVNLGSFSAAAEQLNKSVSSVSRQVQLLEQEVGLPLLIRNTRRLSLTPSGQLLFKESLRICQQIDSLMERLSCQSLQVKGLVKISAPLWYGTHYIAPLLPALHTKHPELTVYLNYSDEYQDPFGAEYDLYVRVNDEKDSSLIARALGYVDYWLCATPSYLSAKPPILCVEHLIDHQLLAQDFRHKSSVWFLCQAPTHAHAQINLSNAWLLSNSSPALLEAALHHGGVALLPHQMVAPYVNEGKLIHLLPDHQLSPFKEKHQVFIVYTKDKKVDLKVKVVSQFLIERLTAKS